MSYAAGVAPEAMPVFQALDIITQELVLDLLDRLAAEGETLKPYVQRHAFIVSSARWRTDAYLAIEVDHDRRAVTLIALNWVTKRT